MRIISRKAIREFTDMYADAHSPLDRWYNIVKKNAFSSFSELRLTFPDADQVEGLTVFNIGGNKYRLIAAIHYNTQKVFIRYILTHNEYDKGKWRK